MDTAAKDIVARIDGYGRWAWIVLMILGFIIFWPVGLALLAYIIWSGRMGCMHYGMKREMRDEWRAQKEEWKDRRRAFREEMRGRWHSRHAAARSSGNAAFDEYKEETIRRLEQEQEEFLDFLDRLRKSKDQAEFDQFMAERRTRRAQENQPENSAKDVTDAPKPAEDEGPRPESY